MKGDIVKDVLKYACPQCKAVLEVEYAVVERTVQCKKCKTKLNLLPTLPEKRVSLLSIEYKHKAQLGFVIAVALFFLLAFSGPFLVKCLEFVFGESLEEEVLAPLMGLVALPFVYGCWYYVKSKGYDGVWGLLGLLGPLGLLVLFFFSDKHKSTKQHSLYKGDEMSG